MLEELVLDENQLPIVVSKEVFDEFAENFEKYGEIYPEDEYPTFEVQYQKFERRGQEMVRILGFGTEKQVAEQVTNLVLEEEVKELEWELVTLRKPEHQILTTKAGAIAI